MSRCEKTGVGIAARFASGALSGGDSGEKAVVPGEPDRSLLVKAINHAGDVHMPPDSKLNVEQIDVLTDWVRQGVPWPASEGSTLAELDAADRAKPHRQGHWAYQPVRNPPLPEFRNSLSVVRNPIDAFRPGPARSCRPDSVTRRRPADAHSPRHLRPDRPAADARGGGRLCRPTPPPDAFERLVDRLLASPHYGERWGRHWLDVARYADTKGYVFDEDRRYPLRRTPIAITSIRRVQRRPALRPVRPASSSPPTCLPPGDDQAPRWRRSGFLTLGPHGS